MKRLLILMSLILAGCATTADPPPSKPVSVPYPEPVQARNGSLFHTQSPVSLFADQRARQLGDVLTIRLEERTQARTSSSTETSKGTEISLPNPTLFGAPVTRGGNPLLTTDVASDNAFNGSGASEQTNQLDGFITAQVVDITPNGLLRVHGEKRLRINRGDETIVLTGLVRPQDIGPDNTVPSLRVADADISYRGRGQLGQANQQGWLGRFFNSPLWPF
ncbi:MAG: flagellar basal body L-ring protein FlgH [Algiphilus sp.]|uniref:flagellar basal body L-ring protein FlgH n=1 Tax=Algiphilus sp. TaxID=1872431 RepID=UPI0025BFBB36|nr:flagellar basal body L-ring protein FlgH [Algiphilus sp.]MBY8967003.1 flagellar basal body L-ring protein FlgH [Algiphilus acroporae]MCI5063527.1 flagellar basal body L-ring protein FlgH [Algiphilus sp.]MCI5102301.1 flagellar basal body L-ring protein FlgH [Algiphilus sp.]